MSIIMKYLLGGNSSEFKWYCICTPVNYPNTYWRFLSSWLITGLDCLPVEFLAPLVQNLTWQWWSVKLKADLSVDTEETALCSVCCRFLRCFGHDLKKTCMCVCVCVCVCLMWVQLALFCCSAITRLVQVFCVRLGVQSSRQQANSQTPTRKHQLADRKMNRFAVF